MEVLYRLNGYYFGFIKDGLLFSRDGEYLGWVEGKYVWDSSGKFRGVIFSPKSSEHKYIIRDRLSMPPVTRPPKPVAAPTPPPAPPPNIPAISLPVEWVDAFDLQLQP